MRLLLATAALLLLAGCAHLENRLACSVGGGPALFISMYGPWGVASKVSEADSRALCPAPKASPRR